MNLSLAVTRAWGQRPEAGKHASLMASRTRDRLEECFGLASHKGQSVAHGPRLLPGLVPPRGPDNAPGFNISGEMKGFSIFPRV